MTARLYSADDGQTPNFTMKIINIQRHRNTEVWTQNNIQQSIFAIPFSGSAFTLVCILQGTADHKTCSSPMSAAMRVILALCFTRNKIT